MKWIESWRNDPISRIIADRHYNRQKIGAPGFVPPGRCLVLKTDTALWVTSYPFAKYVKHAWAGAWVNSLFRNEGFDLSSELILQAVAATKFKWEPPTLGMVSFVDPRKVPPMFRRGKKLWGYCYLKAGFSHVGFTKAGLWVWQLLPENMPEAKSAIGQEYDL